MIGMDLVLGGAPGMVGGVARRVISRAGMFGGALDFMASSAGSMGASLVDAVAWYGGRNRFSFFAKGAQTVRESKAYTFKLGEDVAHFEKHGTYVANKLDLGSGYSVDQYVQDANHIIREGIYVPKLHGYVKIPTGSGSAQAPFVGLDRATNEITTFHMKPVSFFDKNAPSLGWSAKPASEMTDLVGLNRELGWKSPYRMN